MRAVKMIERDIKRLEKLYKQQLITATFTRQYDDYYICEVIKKRLQLMNNKYYELLMREV